MKRVGRRGPSENGDSIWTFCSTYWNQKSNQKIIKLVMITSGWLCKLCISILFYFLFDKMKSPTAVDFAYLKWSGMPKFSNLSIKRLLNLNLKQVGWITCMNFNFFCLLYYYLSANNHFQFYFLPRNHFQF